MGRHESGAERVTFVDESKVRDYLLVAVAVRRSDIPEMRRAMRSLVLRGQSRLHMRKESDPRRRLILSSARALPLAEVVVSRAPKDGRTDVARRADCIRRLVEGTETDVAVELCFELDETLLRQDRQHLVEAAHRLPTGARLRHRHESAAREPLLALPDAIAWAWSKGGDWRRQCGSDIVVRDV